MTLTREEEQQIRDSVRQGLDRLRHGAAEERTEPASSESPAKVAEAERIIADETERYYSEQGLVKHVSRSGRVAWLNKADVPSRGHRRGRNRKRRKIDRKIVLVWAATILVALLLAAYLIHTEVIGGVSTPQ